MSGIFPSGGVNADNAINTVKNPLLEDDCEAKYYAPRCRPIFDPNATNALISELLTVMKARGFLYDCNELNNLSRALKDYQIFFTDITPIVTPTDLQGGPDGAIINEGSFTIPNESPITIPVIFYTELVAGLKLITPDTVGVLALDIWNDAALTDNFTTAIIRYDFTGGTQLFTNRHNVLRLLNIPSGGKKLWWTLRGRASNTGDWQVVEAGTALIANVKFRAQGMASRFFETSN